MILLDTNTLVWWVMNPDKLSPKAQEAITKAAIKGKILISSISVWEINLLVNKGRLTLKLDTDRWIEKIGFLPYVEFVPVDNQIASASVNLPGNFHKDPADRMIVATARHRGVSLITSDEKIRNYSHVQTVW